MSFEDMSEICPSCGINKIRSKKFLTREERKKIYFYKEIRMSAVVIVLGGMVRATLTFPSIAWRAEYCFNPDFILQYIYVLSQILLIGAGIALRFYKRWAVFVGMLICIYSVLMSLFLPKGNLDILGIIILIFFLYFIIHPISRKILV